MKRAMMCFVVLFSACTKGIGGGRDALVVNLPFAEDYSSLCVQGAKGKYSHRYRSTKYDIDMDTPNDSDDPIYAPYSGTAYVHTDYPGYGFGNHINIDVGDGTYILLGHLSDVLVEDGEEVAAGELIGVEGTTGNSTGDHVHMGRHEGDAGEDGTKGVSIQGLMISAFDENDGMEVEDLTTDMVCDLSIGHYYRSLLNVPMWHPDGMLIKSYSSNKVYILDDGKIHHIANENVFWSYNYNFSDVVIVSNEELACYSEGAEIGEETQISAARYNGAVWLLLGESGQNGSYAVRLRDYNQEAVLDSWGISVASLEDLPDGNLSGYEVSSDYAQFRDGAIVKERSTSDVYIISGGVAMPILDWNTYLQLGLANREIITVDDGSIAAVQDRVGDCEADLFMAAMSPLPVTVFHLTGSMTVITWLITTKRRIWPGMQCLTVIIA